MVDVNILYQWPKAFPKETGPVIYSVQYSLCIISYKDRKKKSRDILKCWNKTYPINFPVLPPQIWLICHCPECDRSSLMMSSASPSYSVNVTDCWRREVIVDDKVHPLEVNTTGHEFCAYQNPDFSFSECPYNIITLKCMKESKVSKVSNS